MTPPAPRPDHPLLATFSRERCSAILRTPLADRVAPSMQAAVDGGFRIIEFTLTTPNALDHITSFAANSELTVGAGTVLTIDEADQAVAAGAKFIVSPVADPEIIGWCVNHEVLCIPGAFTPTEILRAHRAGADLVKLFPGPPDGANWIKVCRGPLPFVKLFPTSGVTAANAREYLDAGAFGVGFVNCLFEPEDLAEARYQAIRERAQKMVRTVRDA